VELESIHRGPYRLTDRRRGRGEEMRKRGEESKGKKGQQNSG
jgi:hypothetical protein